MGRSLKNIRDYISTHTLTWSVTQTCLRFKLGYDISTHTLTWSVTYKNNGRTFKNYNFNSHAHVERDKLDPTNVEYTAQISTHTLTWSVTCSHSDIPS